MQAPNFIPDRNPFQLATPPRWWLDGVFAFDPDLVIIPSRRKPVYVLARRKKYTAGFGPKAIDPTLVAVEVNDTAMCISYGLVRLSFNFTATGPFTSGNLQFFLDSLRRRDTWRHDGPMTFDDQVRAMAAGGSRLTKQIEDQERDADARTNRAVRDELYHATGDAWRSLAARKGSRTLNAGQPSKLVTP